MFSYFVSSNNARCSLHFCGSYQKWLFDLLPSSTAVLTPARTHTNEGTAPETVLTRPNSSENVCSDTDAHIQSVPSPTLVCCIFHRLAVLGTVVKTGFKRISPHNSTIYFLSPVIMHSRSGGYESPSQLLSTSC